MVLASAATKKGPQSVLDEAYGKIMSAEGDETEDHMAPRQSSSEDGAASAAPAGFSGQRSSTATTRRPARKSREM